MEMCVRSSDVPPPGSHDVAVSGKGFRARRMRFDVPTVFAPHSHRCAQLTFVYEGEWIDEAASVRRTLIPWDVLFHPSHVEHRAEAASAGTRVVVIDIDHTVIAGFCSLYGNRPRSIVTSFDEVDGIPERIDREMGEDDPATALVIGSLILQLLALGSRSESSSRRAVPDWVARVVAYINTNLSERLTARRIAAIAHLSESYLAHNFSEYFQCGVGEYVRNCRVRAAARALRHSNQSIKEIAADTGFSDHAHLCRMFKTVHGMTPTDYRENDSRIRQKSSRHPLSQDASVSAMDAERLRPQI
jgi:AraC-like DNA-binding protein/quercetin dioxygenase-like cupin family protein